MPTIKRSNVLSVAATVLAGFSLILFSGALDPAQAAGVGKDGTIVAKKGKAKTLDELIAMYDSSSCIECHEEAHNQWANSAHSRSVFGTGRTAATFKTAFTNGFMSWAYSGVTDPQDVEIEHLMGCAKCHLPQLADATDAVAKEFVGEIFALMDANSKGDTETFEEKKELLLKLNINCLVCHNRNAIVHKWTDGYPQAGVVFGSSDGAHDDPDFPIARTSPIMGEAIFCGQCHGLGPNLELDNPTQCATAYGSYLFSYVANGGAQNCQECHMRESGLGHDMQSYRSQVMADKAIDWHVDTRPMVWRDGNKIRPKLMVDVSMTNKAGHGIPDGWPTPNRLVLSVSATDEEGEEIFTDERLYMPVPQQFGRTNKMGRGPYEKSGLVADTALHPGKKTHEHFEILFPNEEGLTNSKMDVKVQLWYLPYGNMDTEPFLWKEFTETVEVDLSGK